MYPQVAPSCVCIVGEIPRLSFKIPLKSAVVFFFLFLDLLFRLSLIGREKDRFVLLVLLLHLVYLLLSIIYL